MLWSINSIRVVLRYDYADFATKRNLPSSQAHSGSNQGASMQRQAPPVRPV